MKLTFLPFRQLFQDAKLSAYLLLLDNANYTILRSSRTEKIFYTIRSIHL